MDRQLFYKVVFWWSVCFLLISLFVTVLSLQFAVTLILYFSNSCFFLSCSPRHKKQPLASSGPSVCVEQLGSNWTDFNEI
jgi:hypothetical protein